MKKIIQKLGTGTSLLIAILAVSFLLFTAWYDGWGITPLSQEESAILYKALSGHRVENQTESSVNPNSVDFFAKTDDGKEFYMLNLIKSRANSTISATDTGIDKRYEEVAFPLLFQRASHPVMVATPLPTFSQPTIEEEWDDLFIIRYRSRRDLFNIVTNEGFQKAWDYKLSSIDKTTVIPVRPILPGINLKWIFGLFLLVIGIVGNKIIKRRSASQ